MRLAAVVALALTAAQGVDLAEGVRAKLKLIQTGHPKPGSVILFSNLELNAYAASEIPRIVPEGVREPRLELRSGAATGYARIDFLRLQHAQGTRPPWLLAKMIEGERPVKVNAHFQSGNGIATVYLDRVEISGLGVSGAALDFLIQSFFLSLFPDAKINRPFELHSGVDHIEVVPGAARVVMRR